MLRFAKLSLLLAPLLMASISGCATPSWMSSSEPTDPREARVNRLMGVAAEYESEGKPDAAMRVYEHVLAQQPDHPSAIERRDLLAQQGVKSGGRSLRPETAPSKELYASHQRPKAVAEKSDVEDMAAQIHRKNAEIAKMLAQQKSPGTPVVVMPGDSDKFQDQATPTPIPEKTFVAQKKIETLDLTKSVAAVDDPGWTAASTSGGWKVVGAEESQPSQDEFLPAKPAATPVVATKELPSDEFVAAREEKPVPAVPQTEHQDELVADSGWAQAEESPQSRVELASLAPSQTAATEAAANSDWQTTDLTRSEPQAPSASANDGHWENTKLVHLCEGLPENLIPLVKKLESPEATERVEGLLQLGELKSAARPASVAVYALMEDQDPVVAVYAAGTLRQTTGDAWSSVHTLTGYLEHTDPGIAQLSAYLLGQMGPEAMDAVPVLEKVRNSAGGLTSLHAAEALTHIAPADAASVDKLTAALSNDDRELRWFAAVSLGTVAGECESQAAVALKSALADQEEEVRVAACLSLGGLGSNAAIAIPELEQAAKSDDPELKSAAETALACLRG